MDRFVKLSVGYYLDPAVAAALDDAGEVLFTRALAYCGAARTAGFVSRDVVYGLIRRPTAGKVKRLTAQLVTAGLWRPVEGGWLIRSWEHWQDQLDVLDDRRRRDRERKAAKRAEAKQAKPSRPPGVRGMSADFPPTVRTAEEEEEEDAASSSDTREPPPPRFVPVDELPGEVAVLRTALEAARLVVRWDRLTPDQAAHVADLATVHGDAALVKAALAAHRPDHPAAFAQAWIATWAALPPPGRSLALVPEPRCTVDGHEHEPASHCSACRSEQIAAHP